MDFEFSIKASKSLRANSTVNSACFCKNSFDISNFVASYSVRESLPASNSCFNNANLLAVNACSKANSSSNSFFLKPCSATNKSINALLSRIASSILFCLNSLALSFASLINEFRLTNCSDCCPVILSSMSAICVSASS